MIYGTASYYSHLRFEPAEAVAQTNAVNAQRPPETAYLGALDAALAGARVRRPRAAGKPAQA
jgi:hypothetical protein